MTLHTKDHTQSMDVSLGYFDNLWSSLFILTIACGQAPPKRKESPAGRHLSYLPTAPFFPALRGIHANKSNDELPLSHLVCGGTHKFRKGGVGRSLEKVHRETTLYYFGRDNSELIWIRALQKNIYWTVGDTGATSCQMDVSRFVLVIPVYQRERAPHVERWLFGADCPPGCRARRGDTITQNVVAERVLIMQTMSPQKIISSRTKIRIVQQRFMTSCPQHRV
jgi:hypothetical protein